MVNLIYCEPEIDEPKLGKPSSHTFFIHGSPNTHGSPKVCELGKNGSHVTHAPKMFNFIYLLKTVCYK